MFLYKKSDLLCAVIQKADFPIDSYLGEECKISLYIADILRRVGL